MTRNTIDMQSKPNEPARHTFVVHVAKVLLCDYSDFSTLPWICRKPRGKKYAYITPANPCGEERGASPRDVLKVRLYCAINPVLCRRHTLMRTALRSERAFGFFMLVTDSAY